MSMKIIHNSCEDRIYNPSLTITDRHHLASLVMPIVDPRDGLFYPTLILIIGSYILAHHIKVSAVFTHLRVFYPTYPYQPVGMIKKTNRRSSKDDKKLRH